MSVDTFHSAGFYPASFYPASFYPAGFYPSTAGTTTPTPTPTPTLPPAPVHLPNPEETVWTLGIGGDVLSPRVAAGLELVLTTTLKNNGQTLAFPLNATLAAEVWEGGSGASLFNPIVTWISAAAGTVHLRIIGNQTATQEPGEYRLRVLVSESPGVSLLAYDGPLVIDPSPADGVTGQVWCTLADMETYNTNVSSLMGAGKIDTAGFLNVRVKATEATMNELARRYNPKLGFVKVRQTVPIGQIGFDVPDPTVPVPTPRQIAEYLSFGGLILEVEIREVVARRALAIVLGRQNKPNFIEEAERHRMMAERILRTYQMRIDADGDGIPDMLVGHDVIFLPEGTV